MRVTLACPARAGRSPGAGRQRVRRRHADRAGARRAGRCCARAASRVPGPCPRITSSTGRRRSRARGRSASRRRPARAPCRCWSSVPLRLGGVVDAASPLAATHAAGRAGEASGAALAARPGSRGRPSPARRARPPSAVERRERPLLPRSVVDRAAHHQRVGITRDERQVEAAVAHLLAAANTRAADVEAPRLDARAVGVHAREVRVGVAGDDGRARDPVAPA